MRNQHLELAAMFWELIDDLEFEHQKRDQTGSPLFLAVSPRVPSDSGQWSTSLIAFARQRQSGSRELAREFQLAIKIEDGQLEAWESLAHRSDSLKLPRSQYPEIKNKSFPRKISSKAEKINILTVPVERSNLKCDWENFTLDRCSIKRQEKGWIQFDFAVIARH